MTARTDDGGGASPRRASELIDAARERTASAYEAARSRAGDVTRQAQDQLAIYPVAAVIGGFAVGALLAAVLPRTERERTMLGETGRKITGAAREAAQRGIDAGKEQLEQIRNKAARQVGDAVADVVAGKP
jgi:F0F1-type ATP synthase membrane subunit b/b'